MNVEGKRSEDIYRISLESEVKRLNTELAACKVNKPNNNPNHHYSENKTNNSKPSDSATSGNRK